MKRFVTVTSFIFLILPLWSQEKPENTAKGTPAAISNGFEVIEMGMNRETVQENLYRSAFFFYQGEPEVTMLDRPAQTLLNCEGRGIVQKATFHFYEGKLFVITLILNPKEIDYYTLFTQFTKKYGDPEKMSPKAALWENEKTRLGLENPLAIRFVDVTIFDSMEKNGKIKENIKEKTREDFLELF